MQKAIPALFMRGGTSRGPFFNAADLPDDAVARDQVLLAVLGSPDRRQIDGMGGAHPLTSKVGIVSPSQRPGIDLEFLFAQVTPDKALVDTTPNCGNMLAAVVPFALETGLAQAQGDTTTLRVLTLNTDMAADITVQTPDGQVSYQGDARIDGVPGTSAPVTISFLDTAGSVCAGLLPTGKACDEIDGLQVTCIDNGMPMVLLRAEDVGRSGHESVDALNRDAELRARLESLRLKAGVAMGLGDVSSKTYPKMCLISPARQGGHLNTRCFIPHVCHEALGVLAAVTVATACVLPGSVTEGVAVVPDGQVKHLSIEHPSGEFTVELETDAADPGKIIRAALLRTARLLMRGEIMIPADSWK
ncbi:4-oxalomesaconate tautomerase [Marinospirillum alkaliphilum]|uniref:4-oxalomesaconate tautomerase n=1 Tax=Marinospirillum alkaliphilum DSM 21637 TaxID=1122209 RepID=A0A1K1TJ20_9GAMM|nr:4-oxalomesaconate tautomerase [Marinospirillum alkaliphilum]SFW99931.1 4-oxalomesaconate tautomerase [Marinospirillum alkaliphilum DSM 21637]